MALQWPLCSPGRRLLAFGAIGLGAVRLGALAMLFAGLGLFAPTLLPV